MPDQQACLNEDEMASISTVNSPLEKFVKMGSVSNLLVSQKLSSIDSMRQVHKCNSRIVYPPVNKMQKRQSSISLISVDPNSNKQHSKVQPQTIPITKNIFYCQKTTRKELCTGSTSQSPVRPLTKTFTNKREEKVARK